MVFLLVLLMAATAGLSFFIIMNINSSEQDQKLAIKRLQDDVKRKSHELEDTQIHLKEFIDKHQQKENDREAVNEQLKELHKLRDMLKQRETEIAKLTRTNEGLNNDLSSAKKNMEKLNTELASVNEVYNGLKEQYAELEKEMETSKDKPTEFKPKPAIEKEPPKDLPTQEKIISSNTEKPNEAINKKPILGKENIYTLSKDDSVSLDKDKTLDDVSKNEDKTFKKEEEDNLDNGDNKLSSNQ